MPGAAAIARGLAAGASATAAITRLADHPVVGDRAFPDAPLAWLHHVRDAIVHGEAQCVTEIDPGETITRPGRSQPEASRSSHRRRPY